MKKMRKSVLALFSAILVLATMPTSPANASGGLIDGTVHVNVSVDNLPWIFTESTGSHVNWNVSLTDENGLPVNSFGPEYSVSVDLVYKGEGLCAPGIKDGAPFTTFKSIS